MTIYHKHHIVPKHAGGTDDPKNLIKLSIEEHAEAHKLLFEIHGKIEDKIAWMGLSNLLTKQEIVNEVLKEAGRKSSRTRVENGTHPFLGGGIQHKRIKNGTHNFLDSELQRKTQLNRVKKGTHPFLNNEIGRKANQDQIESGKHSFITKSKCPHCLKVGQTAVMKRWHFDNCNSYPIG